MTAGSSSVTTGFSTTAVSSTAASAVPVLPKGSFGGPGMMRGGFGGGR
jgi:hypothetical protein